MKKNQANAMRIVLYTIIMAGLLFSSSVLNAESPDDSEAVIARSSEVSERRSNPFEVDSTIRYFPSRKANAMSGKVGISEAESQCSYEFKAFDKLPVGLSLEALYIGINNTTGVELPSHLTGLGLGIETTLPFFKFNRTYLRLGVNPAFYSDDWGVHSSAFRIPSHTFLIHQPNDKLTLIAGVAVYPDFEHSVLPVFGFIYKPNNKWAFNITPRDPNISYILNDRITLFAEGGSSLGCEFEVTKDNLKNVVLRYNQLQLGAGIKYKFNKFIQSSISVGGVFNRYFKYRDSLGKINLKDGLYTEFRVDFSMI